MVVNKGDKGFSGLSDLVSEVNAVDESTVGKKEIKASAPEQHHQPQTEPATIESKQEKMGSSQKVEKGSSDKDTGGSAAKWIWGVICLGIVLWLLSEQNQKSPPPSYDPPSSSENISYPQNSLDPTASNPSSSQMAEITYTKPSVGTDNVLSEPQIRWCLREGIRIDAMRNVIYTSEGIDEFNRIVDDYNRRCSSFRYYQDSYSRAERDVEASRSQIISKAIQEAKQLEQSIESTLSAPYTPSAQYIREAQQLLTNLGYDPGPIDGIYGRRTANAVEAFQHDIGITQDAQIDQNLLNMLRKAKAIYDEWLRENSG